MRRAFGFVRFIVGAFLSLVGVVTLVSSDTYDLSHSAVVEIELAYLAVGLFFAIGGWQLSRKRRTPEAR